MCVVAVFWLHTDVCPVSGQQNRLDGWDVSLNVRVTRPGLTGRRMQKPPDSALNLAAGTDIGGS